MLEPAWPIIVQWDDLALQVVGREQWMHDPDISVGPFFLIVDAEGVPWKLVSDFQQGGAMLERAGPRLSPERLLQAIAEDYRADPAEVEDWSLPALARYVVSLDDKFSRVPSKELTGLTVAQAVARTHRVHGLQDRGGNRLWSLDLPWIFGRRRAQASRGPFLDALRARGEWFLTCAKDPSSSLGRDWARVTKDTWRVPRETAGSALATWLTGGTWCLSRDLWLPFDIEDHELDTSSRLFRQFRNGASVFVAALGFHDWNFGLKASETPGRHA